LTFKTEVALYYVVAVAYKGEQAIYSATIDDYLPFNGDILVSWYGFIHHVMNDRYNMQEFELRQPFLVLPFAKMDVLDIHKTDYLVFTN
jgi:hypothetical protein